jgi:hypothetical protein
MRIPHLRQSAVFWILYGFLVLVATRLAFESLPGEGALREQRGFALQHVLRMSQPLLKGGHGHDLAKYLHDAQSTGLVDFFELDEKGHVDAAGSAPDARPMLTDAISESDGWVWGRAESSELRVRIASGFGWRTRFQRAVESEKARLPFELSFVFFVCALNGIFQSRARKAAARGAVESGVSRKKRSKPEAARVARGTSGDIGDFNGVCGRASLFNQAELAHSSEPGKFYAALEEFYADCSSVISRYKGKLHGVHGHELVFYFFERDSALEARLALSAARDLEAVASRRGFRLGVALAAGRLHGAQLLSGYALFGAPVEETSDLVTAMGGAARVWLTDSVASHVRDFAELSPVGKKGAGAFALDGTAGVGPALETARARGAFAELAFHRGDEALAEVLGALTRDSGWERDHYVGVITELRRVPCRRCGPAVVEAYSALLSTELARKDTYRLSSVVALASTLLSRSVIDRSLEKLLLQAVSVKDRRVRANAVELFTKFFPEREIPELRPLIRDEDNRVSANALIKAACERFDEKVIARIDERVRGGSVAHVASALHAMGEIALHYRRHDPLFLGTKHSFLRLFDGVPGWANHPNTMIRRQALIAAHKLQSEPLDARLREVFSTCSDPELLGLFASVYGWRKDTLLKAA